MAEIISTKFQLKRGLANAWERNNPILAPGEPGWTLDTHVLKIGDGVTPWNMLDTIPGEEILSKFDEFQPISVTEKEEGHLVFQGVYQKDDNLTDDTIKYTPQTLIEEQKAQARENIGAVTLEEVLANLPIYNGEVEPV